MPLFNLASFFSASKTFDHASLNATEVRSLPRDMYGFIPDESLVETKYVRPRLPTPDVFMGEARDVASFLSAGVELAPPDATEDIAETVTTTRLFLDQELQRQERLAHSTPSLFARLSHLLLGPTQHHPSLTNHTDLGLTLDYESRLFQPINPTATNDIHPLAFDRPMLANSPSKTHHHLYKNPLRLPPELPGHLSPLAHLSANRNILSPEDLHRLQDEVKWPTVRFVTNVAVPRGRIPAVLTL